MVGGADDAEVDERLSSHERRCDERRRALQRRRDQRRDAVSARGPELGQAGVDRAVVGGEDLREVGRVHEQHLRLDPAGPAERPLAEGGGPGDAGHAGCVPQGGDDGRVERPVDADLGSDDDVRGGALTGGDGDGRGAAEDDEGDGDRQGEQRDPGAGRAACSGGRDHGHEPASTGGDPGQGAQNGRECPGDQDGRGAGEQHRCRGEQEVDAARGGLHEPASPRRHQRSGGDRDDRELGGEAAHTAPAEHALAVCAVGGQPAARPRTGHHDRRSDRGRCCGDHHDHRSRHPAAPTVGHDQPREGGADGGGEGDERHALHQRTQGDRGDRRPTGTLGEQERLATDHQQPRGEDERERPHRREADEQHRRLSRRAEEARVGGPQHDVQRAVDRRCAPVRTRQRTGPGDDPRHVASDRPGVRGAQLGRVGREPEGHAGRLTPTASRASHRAARRRRRADPRGRGPRRQPAGVGGRGGPRRSTTPATWRRRARTDRSRRPRRHLGSAR